MGAGGLFYAEKWAKEFYLGRNCGRLAVARGLLQGMMSTAAAGAKLVVAFGVAESPEGDGLHAYPAGAYFCMHKSRQNALGAVPQDPLTLKLRLDTNWTFQQMLKSRSVRRRRYALEVPAAHYILDSAGTELKINLISVIASDATFA